MLALQGCMVGMVGYLHFVLRPCSKSASRLQLGCEPDLVPKMWSLVGQVSAFLVLVDCCVTIGCLWGVWDRFSTGICCSWKKNLVKWIVGLMWASRWSRGIELLFVCSKIDVVVINWFVLCFFQLIIIMKVESFHGILKSNIKLNKVKFFWNVDIELLHSKRLLAVYYIDIFCFTLKIKLCEWMKMK